MGAPDLRDAPAEGDDPGEDAPAPTLATIREKHPSSGRARTISAAKKLTPHERRMLGVGYPDWADKKPETRGDCGPHRPCPYVSCVAHLYLDVDEETGSLKINFPDLEVWQMPFTCSIDEAEATEGEGMTLEQVAARTNLTRERVRQIEDRIRAQHRSSRLRVIVDG